MKPGSPEAHAALRNADAKTPLIASHDRWLSHVRPMGSMYRYPPAGHVRVMKAKCLDTRMLTIVAGLSRSFEVTNNWAVPFATLIKNSLCAHRKSEFQHSLRRSTTCAVIRVSYLSCVIADHHCGVFGPPLGLAGGESGERKIRNSNVNKLF